MTLTHRIKNAPILFGIPFIMLVMFINLAWFAAVVYVIVSVLQYMGVL